MAPLLVSLGLAGVCGWSWLQAQGVPPAPGGFLETATSTAVRPRLTAQDLQAFIPDRGPFSFPAPYGTTGIRLTNASDCGGADCVDYVGYSYWPNMNNSAGSNHLYAFVGLNRNRGGAGPSLFRYDKTTGETVNLGPLFDDGDPADNSTGEGFYFSATQPTTLYVPGWQELRRYDVLTHTSSVVFDIADRFGDDKYLFQVHSSSDDRVHSFTLKLSSNYSELGCAIYREDTQQFKYFPAHGFYDECQVDKSGHWLLIKEDVDGKDEVDNRIINLDTGVETVLLDPDGAGGHSDNGFGLMIAADNHHPLPNAIRLWTFGLTPPGPGTVVYRDPQWIPQSMQHLSFANARSAPLDQQYACGSAVNRTDGPRANEVACFRLDGSLSTLVVAPVMTDLDATGGGSNDYARDPKGNLDPTGQYFMWTSNLMGNRLDAFIVRVPSALLVTPPADTTAPTVSISAPAQQDTVGGDVAISATAADTVGVVGVQFQLDGVSLGSEILAPPFAWTWHTPDAADGVHALTAVARDAAGNVTVSPSVAVTVLNAPTGPAISGVEIDSVTGTAAIVGWTTDQLADSLVEYGQTLTYGNATTLDAALVSAHLQTLAGLSPNTTYHYRVTSKNALGLATTSADLTFTTLPAPLMTGVAAAAVTPTSATITWTTDLASDSSVLYGPSITFLATAYGDGSFVTSHALGLSGLVPGATYHFKAHSMTSQGVESYSGDLTFTTPFFVISNIATSAVTSQSAVVSWSTSAAASTLVEYGLTTAYGSATALDPALVTTHGQSLVGLMHTSTYHYRVWSTDAQGHAAASGDSTFTTPPGVYVSNVAVSGITGASAAVTWTTDQPADTQIAYGVTSAYGSVTTLNAALATGHGQAVNGGVQPGTTYHFQVRSRNAAGLLGTSSDMTFTTAPAAVITGVSVAAVTGTTATIAWTTDIPANSRIEYGFTSSYGSTTALDPALVTAHSHTMTGLTPGATYFYLVRSVTALNALTKLGGFTVTTVTTPVIGGVAATGVTATSATIGWTTTQPADSQVEYGVTTAYGSTTALDATLTTAHSQGLTGLAAATTYHYRVTSHNDAGTSTSGDFTFTTPVAPPVISNVAASGLGPTTATITWATDIPASAAVYYGLTSTYGSLTIDPGGEVTSHGVGLTGLTANTTYHYQVKSGAAGGWTASGDGTFTTTEPAPVISGVAVSGVTTAAAAIAWTTDVPADSQVEYGPTTAYGSVTALDAAPATAHGQTLTGLTIGTTYHYRALSRTSGGLTASVDATFTTTVPALVISNVQVSATTTSSATITWTTDQAGDSQVEYGLTTAYGSVTVLDAALVTAHGQTLAGLTVGTTYHYRVKSRNGAGMLATSADGIVATSGGVAISNVTVSSITGASASVTWTTDQPADTQVAYGVTTAYGSLTTLSTTLATGHGQAVNGGVQPGTTYHFQVRSRNAAGLLGTSPDMTFTTAPAAVITGVSVAAVTGTTATIAWTTDIPANSRIEYGFTTSYGSTTVLDSALVTAHSHTISGLTPGATYFYLVRSVTALNALTKLGGFTVVTVTTPVISGVTATAVTATSATIGWTTTQAADSQVEYGVTTAYGSTTALDATLVTAHSLALAGLAPLTTYHYRVTSQDSGGSTTSGDFTFATVEPPPVISEVIAAAITTGATIGWTTDRAADSQIEYGLTTAYGSATALNTTPVTVHSQVLAGLTPATTYHYRVRSATAGGPGTSADGVFTTLDPAPVISGVAASQTVPWTATVSWTTDLPSDSQVEFGVTTAYGQSTALDATPVTAHSQVLTAFTAGATLHYRVKSKTSGGLSVSADFTFTSLEPPPTLSNIVSANILSRSAEISWNTDFRSDSQVEYGLTTAYGSATAVDSTPTQNHVQALSGLTTGTTYHYRVKSATDGGLSVSGDQTFTTDFIAPNISSLTAAPITTTTATIGWTTDVPADSQVEYGLTSGYGSATPLDATAVTAHSRTLAGLTPGTTYHYRALSRTSGGLTASADATFTTSAPAPVISSVQVSAATASWATIDWSTDQAADSLVEYGPTTAYGSSVSDASLVTTHGVTVTGLTAGMPYHYRVQSRNGAGLLATSADGTFTTSQGVAVSNVTVSNITGASAAVTWTTDQPADTQIEYGVTSAYGSLTSLNTTLATGHGQAVNGGVQPGTTYHFRVRSRNAAGVLGTSPDMTFTTAPAPVITGVSASTIANTTVTVTWTTDLPSNSKIEYGLTASLGSQTTLDPALVTSHIHQITGLTPGTTYSFLVRSATAQNALAKLGGFTVTTLAPPIISSVSATGLTGTSAAIQWTTDQPTDSQVEYGVTTAYGSTTTLDPAPGIAHGQGLTGLTPLTTYHFRVLSRNAGGLTTSGDFTFTTLQPAPVILSVTVTPFLWHTALVSWTTDLPADSQVEFGPTTAYGGATVLNSVLVTNHVNSAVPVQSPVKTTVHFRIRTATNGGVTYSEDMTYMTLLPPPVVSNVSASAVTASSATIGWTTDSPSDTQVVYGLTAAYGSSTGVDTSLVTAHSQVVSGLASGTTYHYRVQSRNADGFVTATPDATFTTVTLPVITNVNISSIQGATAAVTWMTNVPTDTQIEYGLTTAYGSMTAINPTLATGHGQAISGLNTGTTYHLRVRSRSAAGDLAASGDFTFTTAPAPIVSAVATSNVTATSVVVTWTTDLPSNSRIEYGLTMSYGSQTALDPTYVTSHSQTITGLTPGTTYFFLVRATTAQNALTKLGGFSFTTAAAPDDR